MGVRVVMIMIVGMPVVMSMPVRMAVAVIPVVVIVQKVLAQQVQTKVIAVRVAHGGVDVEPLGLGVVQHHAPVVVEFHHRDRALDAVVEHPALL